MNWSDIAAAAATLFFVMDPLGNIPVFNSVLSRFEPRRRAHDHGARARHRARDHAGPAVRGHARSSNFLGLTQPSLNIAGGVLLFIIALRMIFPQRGARASRRRRTSRSSCRSRCRWWPGRRRSRSCCCCSSTEPARIWEWCTALVIAWASPRCCLTTSPFLMRALGDRGLRALERLMGMLLVLLATQMLLNGVREFVRSLAVLARSRHCCGFRFAAPLELGRSAILPRAQLRQPFDDGRTIGSSSGRRSCPSRRRTAQPLSRASRRL